MFCLCSESHALTTLHNQCYLTCLLNTKLLNFMSMNLVRTVSRLNIPMPFTNYFFFKKITFSLVMHTAPMCLFQNHLK